MWSEKYKSRRYCGGSKHQSAPMSVDIVIGETGQYLIFSKRVQGKREESMIVCDNTIEVEGLGKVFNNLGRNFAQTGTKNQQMYRKILQ